LLAERIACKESKQNKEEKSNEPAQWSSSFKFLVNPFFTRLPQISPHKLQALGDQQAGIRRELDDILALFDPLCRPEQNMSDADIFPGVSVFVV
jgi:hypothetical protein